MEFVFYSQPLNRTDWYHGLIEACPDGQDAIDLNMYYIQSIEDLYLKYCLMPCNQSLADECLQNFQNQSEGSSSDGVCKLYDEVQDCLNRSVINCPVDVMAEYFAQAELIFVGTGVICYIMPELTVNIAFCCLFSLPLVHIDIHQDGYFRKVDNYQSLKRYNEEKNNLKDHLVRRVGRCMNC